ncbi:zinc-binding domain-containing protein [Aspergillus leporis]|uniref:Zinc-binding domain-containing protein n=1 Tax=Aspergillus leporis TaxID=41062 RepID=A0A5N5WTD0_9EURO|nr:zinc-binding domain-containing protein [Aspergillus leporis]
MLTKKAKSEKRWSMYPSLHDSNTTNIMGRSICRNRVCSSHGWSSNKIAIIIRMYQEAEYNARVYHQRCKSCNSLSRPSLDNSYVGRVAYHLKKWSGVQMDFAHYFGESKGPPHDSDLCGGCRDGHCIAF